MIGAIYMKWGRAPAMVSISIQGSLGKDIDTTGSLRG